MIYKIANTVLFDSIDGTLRLQGEDEFTKLPLPASRLLDVLLSNYDKVLEREFLLSEVWDKYGLIGSDNNLNQYASILRRTLKSMGVDNIIITVPRVGLRINNDLAITTDEAIKKETKKLNRLNKYIPVIFFILLIVILLFINNDNQVPKMKTTKTIHLGCEINYLTPHNVIETNKLNNEVMKILSEHKRLCNKYDIIYFDFYHNENSNDLGRTLLSICVKGVSDEISNCDNFYYYNRKRND